MHRLLTAGIALLGLSLGLCACTLGPVDGEGSASTAPAGPTSSTADPLRIAVVGDSNTTGLGGTLDRGVETGSSYAAQLGHDDLEVVGGWAHDGASSELMAAQVTPVADVDVLVVMAGTNDPAQGVDAARREAALTTIDGVVSPTHTVLLAVPPIDVRPRQAADMNAELAAFAESRQWNFHDPWQALRSSDDTWLSDYRLDGIHTNAQGYAALGTDVGDYLQDSFADDAASSAGQG